MTPALYAFGYAFCLGLVVYCVWQLRRAVRRMHYAENRLREETHNSRVAIGSYAQRIRDLTTERDNAVERAAKQRRKVKAELFREMAHGIRPLVIAKSKSENELEDEDLII